MPKTSERGIIHILGLLILVGGLIGGVYLVTAGPLKLFSRAQSAPISWPPISDRIEIVDNNGNPITTTSTPKVKLKVTWVDNIIIEENGAGIINDEPASSSYIFANPNPCLLGHDGSASEKHCKTTITWSADASDAEPIQVYVSRPGSGILIPKKLMAEERKGSAEPNWIDESGAVFELYSGASCTKNTIEGDSGCFYNAGSSGGGTLLKSVTVTTLSTPTPTLPQSFRVANSEKELFSAPEYAFTDNPTTIDWDITEGLYFIPEQGPYGQRTVYAQFKLGEFWGEVVQSSVELTKEETQECTINQFAQAFGSRQGDIGYIKNCDVNYDGKINIYDIFDLLRNRPHI